MEIYFAERFYSAVWGVQANQADQIKEMAKKYPQLNFVKIGISKMGVFKINDDINLKPDAVKAAYASGLGRIVEKL